MAIDYTTGYYAPQAVTPATLNDLVEFNVPFRVLDDGTVLRFVPDVWSPAEGDEIIDGQPAPDGWEYVDGYSGQYGYSGPVMHASEYLGGRMARDVLAEPGVYCVVEITGDWPDQGEDGNYLDEDGEIVAEPWAGWALLRQL